MRETQVKDKLNKLANDIKRLNKFLKQINLVASVKVVLSERKPLLKNEATSIIY